MNDPIEMMRLVEKLVGDICLAVTSPSSIWPDGTTSDVRTEFIKDRAFRALRYSVGLRTGFEQGFEDETKK